MLQRLELTCTLDNLGLIRSFVSERLMPLCFTEKERNLLVVAVDEFCANLVIHAQPPGATRHVQVDVDAGPQEMVVQIRHQGNPFDPNAYVEKSVQDIRLQRRKGGLGLNLMRRIMDRIEYQSDGGGNVCRLYKTLPTSSHCGCGSAGPLA